MDEKKHMFRPRELTGWGLHPQTAGGWLASVIYVLVTAGPVLIVAGILTDGFARHSPQMPLCLILAMIWLLICVIFGLIYSLWCLKKYYPRERG